jgi:hypothetical protein
MSLLRGTFRCPVARVADDSYSNPCPLRRTSSVLPNGSAFIRVSVGQTSTEQRHIDGLWEVIARRS